MRHFIVTRFNVAWCSQFHNTRLDDDWLQYRVALFERFTLPSIERQSFGNFRWLILVDDQSPAWLINRLKLHSRLEIVRVPARSFWSTIATIPTTDDWATVTRLDSDDMLAVDFMELLAAESGKRRGYIQFRHGAIRATNGRFYERTIDNGPCLTGVVPPREKPKVFAVDHSQIGREIPATILEGPIAWCCVVHNTNLINHDAMATGPEISPNVIAERFPAVPTHTCEKPPYHR